MKVFLSWSGDVSREVAMVLREWLPSVLQSVDPYVSSEDIDKGARWATDIAKELEASSFGILCVTPENLDAPWLHFEAGALSKTVDKSRVSPFLIGVKRSEIQGPLLQFQSTLHEQEDVKKLVLSVNAASGDGKLDEGRLVAIFDVWWPQLEDRLAGMEERARVLQPDHPGTDGARATDLSAGILEELLDLARTQYRLLRSPEELLPPQYLRHVVRELPLVSSQLPPDHPAWDEFRMVLREVSGMLGSMPEGEPLPRELVSDLLSRLLMCSDYICSGPASRRSRRSPST
jgi:hypothetical protein